MAQYNNEYRQEDDFMLWQLHEIRHALAEQNRSPEQINNHAQEILKQYHLTNLKIVRNVERVVMGRAGQRRKPKTKVSEKKSKSRATA